MKISNSVTYPLGYPRLVDLLGPLPPDEPAELRDELHSPQDGRVGGHFGEAVDGESIHGRDGRVFVQQPRRLLEEPVRDMEICLHTHKQIYIQYKSTA